MHDKFNEIAIGSLDDVSGGAGYSRPVYGDSAAQRAGFKDVQRYEYYKHIMGLPKGPTPFGR